MKKVRKASNAVAAVATDNATGMVDNEMDADALAKATELVEMVEVVTVPDGKAEATSKMLAKARIAKQAAEMGLMPQAEADALWDEAVAACKPSEEAIQAAKDAKAKADEAAKVFRTAKAAYDLGMVSADVLLEKEVDAEKAKAASTEAAKAAKGIGMGGGGTRHKGQMSGRDAAHKILSESEEPMNAKAISEKAIALGYWSPDGATPEMTMSALLQSEAKKADGLFVKIRPGYYALRSAA